MRYILLLCISIFCSTLSGQVYLDKQSQHRFAQLTLGIEGHIIPAGGQQLVDETPFPAMYFPKVHIGGTHFWGHAEFYVSFPITNLGETNLAPQNRFYFSPGIETGGKYYPWRIVKGLFRPYIGAAYAIYDFQWSQMDMYGDFQSRSYIPLHLGTSIQLQHHLINLSVVYSPSLKEEYYFSKTEKSSYQMNPWSIQFGWKYQLETTLGLEFLESKGYTASLTNHFQEQRVMSDFSLAIGPSSAFIIGNDNGNFNQDHPYITSHTGAGIFPEFGLAYYYHPLDMHLNLSYRANASHHQAFDFTQSISRKALTFEAYKFLFDYHGFVPFIGPSISYDRIRLKEGSGNSTTTLSDQQWNPGITFGWDIRPNDVQHWILRTNLRYTPIRWSIEENRELVYDQLEFNFIQLVIYPQRWYQRIQWRKKQFSGSLILE